MVELKKEQKDAIFHDKGSVLVSASAGSCSLRIMSYDGILTPLWTNGLFSRHKYKSFSDISTV